MPDTLQGRPLPPVDILDPGISFRPAPDVEEWIREAFLEEDSPLANAGPTIAQAEIARACGVCR